jgi:DNA-binding NarL/FixJ family response regulator
MIRVLLADDHPVVRSGYLRLLDQAGDIRVVHEAGDADTAYAAFVADPPDVLVTDLSMPAGGGLALIRRVLQRAPDARILVFSMHDSALLVRRAFESGVRGFLTKASPPDSLVEAVRALHAGRRYLASELPVALLQRDPQAESERLAALSGREFEVFRLLAQGCSAAECAQMLKLSAKTISNHQTVIKEKLGVATSAALAHLAIRHRVISTAGL